MIHDVVCRGAVRICPKRHQFGATVFVGVGRCGDVDRFSYRIGFARSSIAWSVFRQRHVVNLFVLHTATYLSLLPCVRPRFALSGALMAGMAIESGRFYMSISAPIGAPSLIRHHGAGC